MYPGYCCRLPYCGTRDFHIPEGTCEWDHKESKLTLKILFVTYLTIRGWRRDMTFSLCMAFLLPSISLSVLVLKLDSNAVAARDGFNLLGTLF